jgi:hypothetical protein
VEPEAREQSELWSFLGAALPIAAVAGSLALAPALASRSSRRAWIEEYGWDPTTSLVDSVFSGGTKCGYVFVNGR